MSAANAKQVEYWNGRVGERWARRHLRIDENLQQITPRVLEFAGARVGETALDVGCGAGTTALALAEAVAPGGVTAIDISRPMLEVAKARAVEAEADIAFHLADASDFAFAPSFDLVFSRFGVMFFADPVAAFANLRRALKPGGRLRFVCWRTVAENRWASAPFEAAKHLLPPQEPSDPFAPGPYAFADAARVEKILRDAGFRDVTIAVLDCSFYMGADADEAAQEALNVGPLAYAARDLGDAARAKARDIVAAMMGQFATPAGITPPAACWLVGAES
ncbi:MAG: methyltransferase domain-containing protein [Alphaproteobacteria bacterium]|nr:methyltransferase domain-containing protein [Alphaproteobacteria bacterium]MDE2011562.1 methyltransferase domain-containing protein [Alphaproteobacteria bacterium]MDE2071908.1 methyltransferase domain-containing protein [Alphaproteobacteria bacterium]